MKDFSNIPELKNWRATKQCPSSGDWELCEADIGCSLPIWYKELISFSGDGRFGLDIGFRNPLFPGFFKFSRESLLDYSTTMDFIEETCGVAFYPKKRGMLHVGKNSFGIAFFLAPKGDDDWSIVIINVKQDIVETYDMELIELLLAIYRKTLASRLLTSLRKGAWPDETYKFLNLWA